MTTAPSSPYGVTVARITGRIAKWVLPIELFNPASIATIYNPGIEGGNVDGVMEDIGPIIHFCERYIAWFDTHVEAIVTSFLGHLKPTASGGFKKISQIQISQI